MSARISNWWWALLASVLLISIPSCARRDVKGTLVHPAISLVRADPSRLLWDPAWSPREDLLAVFGVDFCRTVGGICGQGLYLIDLQTLEFRRFLDNDDQFYPTWTANPDVVGFFWHGNENQPQGIYVANLTDEQPHFFANGRLARWSPDGKYVAIDQGKGPTRTGDYERPWVSVIDLTTDEETKVFEVPHASEEVITGLAWSAEDDLLAISATWKTAEAGYTNMVYIVEPDGTGLRELMPGGWPNWMPDGQWLVFASGKESELVFAPLDGSCVLAPLGVTGISSPAISPSGSQIAFVHDDNIYLLDLDRLLGLGRKKLICPD